MGWDARISYLLIQTAAMIVTVWLIPNLHLRKVFSGVLTVVAIAGVNTFLWDAALFFEVPQSFSTHAALLLLINGMIFWVLVKLLPGIEVEGVLPAIAAPVVFSIISLLMRTYGPMVDWEKLFDEGYQLLSALFVWLKQVVNSE